MVKELKGEYRSRYTLWRIKAPHTYTVYIYSGAYAGATKFATKLYKQGKFLTKPTIKEIRY
jgi:hypothetical protein